MISISYEELAARLLAEVRRQPGCGGMADVSIVRVTDEGAANNWAIGEVSCGSVTPSTAKRAAIYAAANLKRDFNLLSDA
jgi:hypothetical protein